jgi:aquaporin Z
MGRDTIHPSGDRASLRCRHMEPLEPPDPGSAGPAPTPSSTPPAPGSVPPAAPSTTVAGASTAGGATASGATATGTTDTTETAGPDMVAVPTQPVVPVETGVAVTDVGRIFAAEFVGTAVLILGGPGAAILSGGNIGQLGISLAFGFALLFMIYVIGPVSGCHINPAITLGMLLTRKITPRDAAYYVVAQVLGGIFGAAIIYGIASGRDGWVRGTFASNGWDRDGLSGLGATVIVEIVFTALLTFVVLSTTTRRFAPGFGGIAAGITLTLIHLVTIPVDNTSVNPARSIATAIFADTSPSALGQLWAFIVFPLIGAVLGVFVWLLIDPASLEDTMLDSAVLRTARDKLDDVMD